MDNNNDRDVTVELITSYFNALKTGDFSDNLFTPDVTLFTPFVEIPVSRKDAVIGSLRGISKGVADIIILRIVIEAEFACAIVEYKNKNGIVVNMCDAYRIVDCKFAEICPYFDPRPLMKMRK